MQAIAELLFSLWVAGLAINSETFPMTPIQTNIHSAIYTVILSSAPFVSLVFQTGTCFFCLPFVWVFFNIDSFSFVFLTTKMKVLDFCRL